MSESAIRTERSFCRVCTSLCGILVDTEGERVLRVRGDRDHPLSRGYTCPKGRALPQMHHHPRRLERPLIRRDGALEPTSWEHCLDDLGARLRDIIDRHGPAAVGIYFGSGVGMDAAGYRMSGALHAAIGTPAKFSPLTIDGTAKVLVSSLIGGFPGLNPRVDYDRANLVIYIGVNPVVSHGHATAMPLPPPTTIRAVRDRGEVWVIDPRRTETAGFASRHLAPRPGTDYAVLAWLVRELLREGADPEVLARRTVDADALRAAVEPFDRETAAAIAGVTPDELSALLASVRRAGRLAIDTGTGVTMSAEANLTQWFAWVLMILTDSMNRRRGVWFHPGFQNRLDAAPLPLMPEPFGPGPPSRPDLPGFLGEWPGAALPDEIRAGNIRAFLNLGGNLVTAFPDENALRPALQQLDVFASLDIIDNETTAISTHVLPTKDQLERPDLTLWDFLSSRVSAQYTPAIVEAVGERRSTWWVLAELMRRLGHEPPGPIPEDDSTPGADDAMMTGYMEHAHCSFDELAQRRYVELADGTLPARWVEEHLDNFGGWHLAPRRLLDQLAELSRPHLAAPGDGAPLRLIPRRQKRHVNAQFLYLGDTAEVLLHPEDAASAGVQDGQQVIVRSARGELAATARVDDSVRRGVASVPHGHESANVNLLTDAQDADPVTGMAHYSGLPVTVHPVG